MREEDNLVIERIDKIFRVFNEDLLQAAVNDFNKFKGCIVILKHLTHISLDYNFEKYIIRDFVVENGVLYVNLLIVLPKHLISLEKTGLNTHLVIFPVHDFYKSLDTIISMNYGSN